MEKRLIGVAAAVLVAGVAAGCGSQPSALGSMTAKVTIDGKDTGGAHAVNCSQTGWSWTIETLGKAKGFTAVVQTGGDTVTAQRVDFRDFDGFTGSFWADNIGKAEAKLAHGKYTITGSADGAFTEDPSKAVTATFRIEADC
jgi:ipoprotein LpqH